MGHKILSQFRDEEKKGLMVYLMRLLLMMMMQRRINKIKALKWVKRSGSTRWSEWNNVRLSESAGGAQGRVMGGSWVYIMGEKCQ